MDNFETALKKSSVAFDKHFRQAVLQIFKGDFEIVEGVTKYKMARTLDQLAGVDLWFFNTRHGVRGVANRIQYIKPHYKPYRTFTVRKKRKSGAKTEYEKRKYAIESEWLYPVLTLQGYVQEDVPLCFAVAKTADIIWMIDNGFSFVRRTNPQQIGQAEFYVVKWDDMQKMDKNIYIAHKCE